MKEAISLADIASKNEEIPVGCIISHRDKIIAKSSNQTEIRNDPCGHAEILSIQSAAKILDNWRLTECVLTVTVEPCTMCVGAIIQSRIPIVVYGCNEPETGALGSRWELSLDTNGKSLFRVIRGINEKECSLLMKEFFKRRRISTK